MPCFGRKNELILGALRHRHRGNRLAGLGVLVVMTGYGSPATTIRTCERVALGRSSCTYQTKVSLSYYWSALWPAGWAVTSCREPGWGSLVTWSSALSALSLATG